jgi:dihydrofolate synthase/folylpolyglutamate synthase
MPSIHIGGTNGKGSTAAMTAAILRAAGHRTGLYTSPHLLSFTERIQVDREWIGEEEIVALTERLMPLCAAHFALETAPPPGDRLPHPTFFELTTAMAFLHFRRRMADVAVVEVGLGGRLDATNVIRPHVAVITNIALEHEEYLGRTVRVAGKRGSSNPVPVITGREAALSDRRAASPDAPVVSVPDLSLAVQESSLTGQVFDLEAQGCYEALRIPLVGRHQVDNAVLAVAAVEAARDRGLWSDEAAIRRGLAMTEWPGRLQIIEGRPRLILDGAHNPAGAQALATFLAEHRAELGRLILVFGVLKDKNWGAMLGCLAPLADEIILTHPPTARGADPAELRSAAQGRARTRVVAEPAEALALARSTAGAADTVLVAGSLYTVAAALRILRPPA